MSLTTITFTPELRLTQPENNIAWMTTPVPEWAIVRAYVIRRMRDLQVVRMNICIEEGYGDPRFQSVLYPLIQQGSITYDPTDPYYMQDSTDFRVKERKIYRQLPYIGEYFSIWPLAEPQYNEVKSVDPVPNATVPIAVQTDTTQNIDEHIAVPSGVPISAPISAPIVVVPPANNTIAPTETKPRSKAWLCFCCFFFCWCGSVRVEPE